MKIMMKDPVLLISCLILPFIFSLVLGTVYETAAQENSIPIVVLDEDHSFLSEKILHNIEKNPSVRPIAVEKEEGFRLLNDSKIEGIYILKPGLEEKIMAGMEEKLVDAYYLRSSLLAPAITDIIAGEMMGYISVGKGYETIQRVFDQYSIPVKENLFQRQVRLLQESMGNETYDLPIIKNYENPNSKSVEDVEGISTGIMLKRSVIGMMLLFIALFLSFSASSIVAERNAKLYQRMFISGYSKWQVVAGNGLAIFLIGWMIGIFQLGVLSIFAPELTGAVFYPVVFIYGAYILCISFCITALASTFRSTVSLQGFAPFFVLSLGILGGCIWSTDWFPMGIRWITYMTPTYWAMDVLTSVLYFQRPFQTIWMNVGILISMAAVYYGLANWSFHKVQ